MNYTTLSNFALDLDNVTRLLEFGKVRRYTVAFNYTEDTTKHAQGASVNYTVEVRNTGTDNATFDLAPSPTQVPGGWSYQLQFDNATLEIGQATQFWILINTSNQTRAGSNKLQLRATPHNLTGDGRSA